MVNGGNIFARQKRCTFRPRRMGLFLVTRFGEINLRIGIHILDFLYLLIYFYKLGIIFKGHQIAHDPWAGPVAR